MYSDDTILVTFALIAAIGVGGVFSLISLVVLAIELAVDEQNAGLAELSDNGTTG